ncbi:MAG: AfsR/SARP family transcriptional regulator [Vicinamibacterales bacterium]
MATPRIYLTGSVAIEHGEQLIRERDFPGRLGRVAFVYLALHRHHTVHRDEMLAALWPDDQDDAGLDPILSKLRGVLRTAGFAPGAAAIDATGGTITLRLPPESWVDTEAAANSLDEAEGALRRHDTAAWGLANTAVVITRRPLLPNTEAPWIESQRSVLRAMQMRGLQCLVALSATNNEPLLAIQHATEMVQLEPFRETAYQLLMRMHAAAGDRAEALRVFARCKDLLREELGVSPSPQTEAVYLEILRAE